MPSTSSSPLSLSRWWSGLFAKNTITDENNDGVSGNSAERSSNSNNLYSNLWGQDDSPAYSSIECYACTQVTAPAFHSTSCDQANAPEWEACAGSSLVPIHTRTISKQHLPGITRFRAVERRPGRTSNTTGKFGPVLDPRSKRVQWWNRAFLLARGVAIAIDPLFFYVLSVGRDGAPCLYMDGSLAAVVTVLRTGVDFFHLWHLWLQFRLAYVSRESLVVGCGKLVWDARAVASHYLRSLKGFWFDLFVILPVPQVVFWVIVPRLIREEKIKLVMTMLLLIFMFQFLPKIYHSLCLMRRMQKVTGYIFGTIWWGFALNLIAYLMASHVAGGCWYVLAIQRVASCMRQQCAKKAVCKLTLSCTEEVCYQFLQPRGTIGGPCAGSYAMTRKPLCLDVNGPFSYGIYKWALPVISSNSVAVKILYPIFWGLMTLSTFGNDLEPTSNWLEVIFSIMNVLAGLMLFTLLIGNIQVFLHAVMAKKRKMQLRCRDMEWWMRRRQLPSKLRKRVRVFERQRWVVMGGDDEMEMIKDLPEGLRRDIKRFLCRKLIRKVPIFHDLDDLIIDNICDRVKPLYFSNDENVCKMLHICALQY
uniref:Ion transport domain-containing protein n=1 Tax=Kalanchoe fedtschenkoi TaxID=63787 RepID=A0A7N0UZ15_KALFE